MPAWEVEVRDLLRAPAVGEVSPSWREEEDLLEAEEEALLLRGSVDGLEAAEVDVEAREVEDSEEREEAAEEDEEEEEDGLAFAFVVVVVLDEESMAGDVCLLFVSICFFLFANSK